MQECPIDYSSIEKSRVRVHSYLYSVDACPHPIVVMKAWLVIENATAEDAEKTYKCHSSQLVLNPTFTYLTSEEVFNVQPRKILYNEYLSGLIISYLSSLLFHLLLHLSSPFSIFPLPLSVCPLLHLLSLLHLSSTLSIPCSLSVSTGRSSHLGASING